MSPVFTNTDQVWLSGRVKQLRRRRERALRRAPLLQLCRCTAWPQTGHNCPKLGCA